jgi:hypothetical protein
LTSTTPGLYLKRTVQEELKMLDENIWVDRRTTTIDRRQFADRWWRGENNRRIDLGRRQAIDDRREQTVDRRQFLDLRFGVNEMRERIGDRRIMIEDWEF